MPPPDLIVFVVDATNLERHLYLVLQVMELGRPLVLALNMMDSARDLGIRIDQTVLVLRSSLVVDPEAHLRDTLKPA